MSQSAARLREVEPASELAAELGRNIRALRKSQSLTLEQLSARSGLSVSFLSLIERGKKKPSLSALQSISDALGMEVGWFFADHPARDPLERAHVVRKAYRRRVAYSRLADTDYLGEVLPAATVLGVTALALPEFDVEVELVVDVD